MGPAWRVGGPPGDVPSELACSLMVGRSSGTLLTRVQILVLASFPGIFLGFTGVTRKVVSDVPVDDEAPVVTSGIFRFAGAQSFGGTHRGRVCVRVFIGCECACVLWASLLYCVILTKKSTGAPHGEAVGLINPFW